VPSLAPMWPPQIQLRSLGSLVSSLREPVRA